MEITRCLRVYYLDWSLPVDFRPQCRSNGRRTRSSLGSTLGWNRRLSGCIELGPLSVHAHRIFVALDHQLVYGSNFVLIHGVGGRVTVYVHRHDPGAKLDGGAQAGVDVALAEGFFENAESRFAGAMDGR